MKNKNSGDVSSKDNDAYFFADPEAYLPSIHDLSESFSRTNDIKYAIYALGISLEYPPKWALRACRDYLVANIHSKHGLVEITPQQGRYHLDNSMLNDMARLVRLGRTKNAAAKEVTKQDDGHPDVRRLTRLWDGEIKVSEVKIGNRRVNPRLLTIEAVSPLSVPMPNDLARELDRNQIITHDSPEARETLARRSAGPPPKNSPR